MLKMYTKDKKWIVIDRGVEKEFDDSLDAWRYVFLMRGIRPKAPKAPDTLHPVLTLSPFPNMKQKKINFKLS